jgi:CBS domain-containing protein
MKGKISPRNKLRTVRPAPRKETIWKMKVKDIMNPKPRTITPDTSIEDSIDRLRSQIGDCFPVIDKERKLVGIVTESDLLHVLHAPMREAVVGGVLIKNVMKSMAKNVGEIMTKNPITVTPEMTIQETLNIMAGNKFRHLPVVQGGKLVGLVDLRDILNLYQLIT